MSSTEPSARLVAYLDASVLVPPLLRRILLASAGRELFAPRLSPRTIEEWSRAAARRGGAAAEAQARDAAAELARRCAQAIVPDVPVTEMDPGLLASLPDPDDAAVMLAARAAGAGLVVTRNLRDFPPRVMARLGLSVQHPDPFLVALAREAPGDVVEAVAAALRPFGLAVEGRVCRDALKGAGLPRLARLVCRQAGGRS